MKAKLQSARAKTHTIYKLKSGKQIVGVTTVLQLLSKPALIHWAWEQGKAGYDYRKVRDAAGEVGTLAHHLISSHLKAIEPYLLDYSAIQLTQAVNSYRRYLEWEEQHKIEPILIEEPLVSELYGYGGTPDLLARLDGELTLVDFKSGGIYIEHYAQSCAYWNLLREKGYFSIKKIIILGIPRDEGDSFKEETYRDFERGFDIFIHLLRVYELLNRKGE